MSHPFFFFFGCLNIIMACFCFGLECSGPTLKPFFIQAVNLQTLVVEAIGEMAICKPPKNHILEVKGVVFNFLGPKNPCPPPSQKKKKNQTFVYIEVFRLMGPWTFLLQSNNEFSLAHEQGRGSKGP